MTSEVGTRPVAPSQEPVIRERRLRSMSTDSEVAEASDAGAARNSSGAAEPSQRILLSPLCNDADSSETVSDNQQVVVIAGTDSRSSVCDAVTAIDDTMVSRQLRHEPVSSSALSFASISVGSESTVSVAGQSLVTIDGAESVSSIGSNLHSKSPMALRAVAVAAAAASGSEELRVETVQQKLHLPSVTVSEDASHNLSNGTDTLSDNLAVHDNAVGTKTMCAEDKLIPTLESVVGTEDSPTVVDEGSFDDAHQSAVKGRFNFDFEGRSIYTASEVIVNGNEWNEGRCDPSVDSAPVGSTATIKRTYVPPAFRQLKRSLGSTDRVAGNARLAPRSQIL